MSLKFLFIYSFSLSKKVLLSFPCSLKDDLDIVRIGITLEGNVHNNKTVCLDETYTDLGVFERQDGSLLSVKAQLISLIIRRTSLKSPSVYLFSLSKTNVLLSFSCSFAMDFSF